MEFHSATFITRTNHHRQNVNEMLAFHPQMRKEKKFVRNDKSTRKHENKASTHECVEHLWATNVIQVLFMCIWSMWNSQWSHNMTFICVDIVTTKMASIYPRSSQCTINKVHLIMSIRCHTQKYRKIVHNNFYHGAFTRNSHIKLMRFLCALRMCESTKMFNYIVNKN